MGSRRNIDWRGIALSTFGTVVAFGAWNLLPHGWAYAVAGLYAFVKESLYRKRGSSWRSVLDANPHFDVALVRRMVRTQVALCLILGSVLLAVVLRWVATTGPSFLSVLFAQLACGAFGAATRSATERRALAA